MNWEYAKNWLIAAFLCLDLFLAWQIVESRRTMAGYIGSYNDLLANTKTILSEHGLILKAQVPADHPDLPLLQADWAQPPLAALAQAVFANNGPVTLDRAEQSAHAGAGTLKLLGPGHWQVSYVPPLTLPAASDGVPPGVWQGAQYTEDLTAPETPQRRVFVQHFAGLPVFDAAVVADYAAGRLVGYVQTMVQNLTASGDARPTLSALDALNDLAGAVEPDTETGPYQETATGATGTEGVGGTHREVIRSLALGYVHKLPQATTGQGQTGGQYWFPVWRVVTDAHIYFVNAYTGEVDLNTNGSS
ncbi:MAG: hypothetical protein K6T26_01220 [Alicyclobacillus sp.]|nr:hypothetical protein [Alicyclobacillus sp.]